MIICLINQDLSQRIGENICFSNLSAPLCGFCVYFCGMCSASLLVETAEGTAAAAFLRPGRDSGSLGTRMGSSGRKGRIPRPGAAGRGGYLEQLLILLFYITALYENFPKLTIFFLTESFKFMKALCLWRHGPQ